MNLAKSHRTLDFIGQAVFPLNAPRAWARRSPFVFCAKFQRRYDIIHFKSFSPPKERQMVKKSKEETLGEDRLICVLVTERNDAKRYDI